MSPPRPAGPLFDCSKGLPLTTAAAVRDTCPDEDADADDAEED